MNQTKSKVIIDKASIVIGDVICDNLMTFESVKGNVFCTGRVTIYEESFSGRESICFSFHEVEQKRRQFELYRSESQKGGTGQNERAII